MTDVHPESSRVPLPSLEQTTPPSRKSPSPDDRDAESKLSRKREREVSLEPLTPSANGETDPSSTLRERKDSRAPLKKNRRKLDPTQEEEEVGSGSRSGSNSPPPNPAAFSPRQEKKMRQINTGVRNISWTNPDKEDKNASTVAGDDVEIEDAPVDATVSGSVRGGGLGPAADINSDHNPKTDENETPPKSPDGPQASRSMLDIRDAEQATQPPQTQLTSTSSYLSVVSSSDAVNPLQGSSDNLSDKNLKRKFLERGTSQGPPDASSSTKQGSEPLKRPRDADEQDDNPRDNKRPSPPPADPSPPSPKVSKPSGFMAYAATSSPFSAVKGSNIFKSVSPSPSPFAAAAGGSASPFSGAGSSSSGHASGSTSPHPSTSTATKRSGFDAFASSSSPFASAARTKSPVLGQTSKLGRAKSPPPKRAAPTITSNPFASYAGTSSAFTAPPAQKRVRAESSEDSSSRSSFDQYTKTTVFGESSSGAGGGSDSGAEEEDAEEGNSSFGARLRASRDSGDGGALEAKVSDARELDVVHTGEEEEETIHQARGKLFSFQDSTWKERGTGIMKLNIKYDGTGARLVMRKDAVHTLILNVPLFAGMRCELVQDPRYLRINAIENGHTAIYNFRVANRDIAKDLLDEIINNLPQ